MKSAAAFLLFSLSALLFSAMGVELGRLWHSAYSFKLHHEVGAPLCVFLIWPILALAAFIAGAGRLGKQEVLKIAPEGSVGALIALVPLLIACAYLFQNEFFFSLYDSKGFPVHPPEIIAHPRGAWVTPRAHALASFLLMASCGLAYFALRGKRARGDRGKGTGLPPSRE